MLWIFLFSENNLSKKDRFHDLFFLRIFPHSRLCVLWTVTGPTTAYLPGTYSPVLAS